MNEQSGGESLAALQDTKHTKNGLEICFSHTVTYRIWPSMGRATDKIGTFRAQGYLYSCVEYLLGSF